MACKSQHVAVEWCVEAKAANSEMAREFYIDIQDNHMATICVCSGHNMVMVYLNNSNNRGSGSPAKRVSNLVTFIEIYDNHMATTHLNILLH